jgi:hypothetical protein
VHKEIGEVLVKLHLAEAVERKRQQTLVLRSLLKPNQGVKVEISEEQLAQIKAHLKVDGDDEDTLIAAYASASVDYVERFCDGALVETLTPPVEGETQPREVIFTSGIWAAMLLLIGHWYANREAAAQNLSEVPLGVEALLIRHRRWN